MVICHLDVLVDGVNVLSQITRSPIFCRCIVDSVDWVLDVNEPLGDFGDIRNLNESELLCGGKRYVNASWLQRPQALKYLSTPSLVEIDILGRFFSLSSFYRCDARRRIAA